MVFGYLLLKSLSFNMAFNHLQLKSFSLTHDALERHLKHSVRAVGYGATPTM